MEILRSDRAKAAAEKAKEVWDQYSCQCSPQLRWTTSEPPCAGWFFVLKSLSLYRGPGTHAMIGIESSFPIKAHKYVKPPKIVDLSCFGGSKNCGESGQAALLREVNEEAGIDLKQIQAWQEDGSCTKMRGKWRRTDLLVIPVTADDISAINQEPDSRT